MSAVSSYLGARRTEVIVKQVCKLLRTADRRLRPALIRSGFTRRRWPLTAALADLILDPWSDVTIYERLYAFSDDPWSYLTKPGELARHRLAVELLDQVSCDEPFERALEIGCSEGVFTEVIAARCKWLLAVDFSKTALSRAERRRDWGGSVRFAHWDLRRDAIPGRFDLVVVMDVLDNLVRPPALRRAITKVIDCTTSGGYLLVGNYREDPSFETHRWAKWLARGGKWINATVAKHPRLTTVATAETDTHVFAVLRKS